MVFKGGVYAPTVNRNEKLLEIEGKNFCLVFQRLHTFLLGDFRLRQCLDGDLAALCVGRLMEYWLVSVHGEEAMGL